MAPASADGGVEGVAAGGDTAGRGETGAAGGGGGEAPVERLSDAELMQRLDALVCSTRGADKEFLIPALELVLRIGVRTRAHVHAYGSGVRVVCVRAHARALESGWGACCLLACCSALALRALRVLTSFISFIGARAPGVCVREGLGSSFCSSSPLSSPCSVSPLSSSGSTSPLSSSCSRCSSLLLVLPMLLLPSSVQVIRRKQRSAPRGGVETGAHLPMAAPVTLPL